MASIALPPPKVVDGPRGLASPGRTRLRQRADCEGGWRGVGSAGSRRRACCRLALRPDPASRASWQPSSSPAAARGQRQEARRRASRSLRFNRLRRWAVTSPSDTSFTATSPPIATEPAAVRPAPVTARLAATWTVVEVIDGDTVDVRSSEGIEERVRVIGIDTPERGECGFAAAADALSRLVLNLGSHPCGRRSRRP